MAYIPRQAKKHPHHLWNVLQKYVNRKTPDHWVKKGEFWGKGQLEISPSQTESWRGQIQSCETRLTDQGMEVTIHLFWYAKRVITRKTTNFFLMTTMEWSEWVELRSPYTTTFVIAKFFQNKDRRRRGVLYPKRLFFTTTTNERGFFARRSDPQNLRWQRGGLFDPVLKKRFACKSTAS